MSEIPKMPRRPAAGTGGVNRPAGSAARPAQRTAGTQRSAYTDAQKRTAPQTSARNARPASGARPSTSGASARRPQPAAVRKPRQKSFIDKIFDPVQRGFASLSAAVTGRVNEFRGARADKARASGKAEVNWSLLVAAAVCLVIVIGIIALLIVGISSCSGGCSTGAKSPENSMKLQIYQEPTSTPAVTQAPTPAPTDENNYAPETTEPSEAVVTPVPQTNTPSNGLREVTIRTAGDFVIHKEVFQSASRLAKSTNVNYAYNFAPMLDYVWDVMGNADFTVTNVDGCLGGKDSYKYGYSGYPQFNTPEYILYALRDCGVDMLTLANNHMLDGWFDGLMNTVKNVEQVGLKHIGASRTKQERNSAVIYEVNGIKIGFLNYTKDLNSMDKASGLDKRAMEFAVHAVRNSNVFEDAKRLRDGGADVIVAFMHWGTEYARDPDSYQKSTAKTLVQAGVDVIIGGHPHVVQKAEWLNGTNQFGEEQETLCLYSLGNFLSFQRERYKDGGIIFDFTIQEQPDGSFKIINPGYLPTWVWLTGTSDKDYTFRVLNIAEAKSNPPAGMSSEDYQKMLTSYNDSIAAMNKGVGALLTK